MSQWHLANSFLTAPHSSHIVSSSLFSTFLMTLLLLILLLLSSSLFYYCSNVCSLYFVWLAAFCFFWLSILLFIQQSYVNIVQCIHNTRYPHEFLMHMIRMNQAVKWSGAKFRYSIWTTNNQKVHLECTRKIRSHGNYIILLRSPFSWVILIGDFKERKTSNRLNKIYGDNRASPIFTQHSFFTFILYKNDTIYGFIHRPVFEMKINRLQILIFKV